MELIYEKSQAGRRAGRVPSYGLPVPEVPSALARKEPPRLPELAENEIVRHFTNLADRNFGITWHDFEMRVYCGRKQFDAIRRLRGDKND